MFRALYPYGDPLIDPVKEVVSITWDRSFQIYNTITITFIVNGDLELESKIKMSICSSRLYSFY